MLESRFGALGYLYGTKESPGYLARALFSSMDEEAGQRTGWEMRVRVPRRKHEKPTWFAGWVFLLPRRSQIRLLEQL